MRSLVLCATTILLSVSSAWAESNALSPIAFSTRTISASWNTRWPSCGEDAGVVAIERAGASPALVLRHDEAQPVHAVAVEHSDAYQTRAKIHKYASFATLPLFAAELALGQSLYNTPGTTGGKKSAHAVVGAGIVGLFAVNTVTGAWNMFGEGRDDKEGRTLRLVHGLLMMASDVGMVATTASAPNSGPRGALTFQTSAATHRNLAVASISVGTAGYLLMLFGNH